MARRKSKITDKTPEQLKDIADIKGFEMELANITKGGTSMVTENGGTPVNNTPNKAKDEKQPKNIILYGPPGTGKTYSTVKKAIEIIKGKKYVADLEIAKGKNEAYKDFKAMYDSLFGKQISFITFHHSYSYEDFIEGIKAETENGQIKYDVKSGVFKDFCSKAGEAQYIVNDKVYGIIDELRDDLNDWFPLDGDYECSIPDISDIKERYQLPEGAEEKLAEKNEDDRVLVPFVFIIDEINRGDISKIFGELITLIEETKRKREPEQMTTTLPYSRKDFSVPENVYIIGTMNTADRSITTVDIALRRRFTFEEMMPQPQLVNIGINDGKGGTIKINELLAIMNDRITALYDREHTIGHSFFMKLTNSSTIEDLGSIFKNKIIPLLQEYFYEDYEKIRLVLGDNQKEKGEPQFILENVKKSRDLFGKFDVLDEDAKIYKINDGKIDGAEYDQSNDAFIKPEAYRYLQEKSSSSGVSSGGSSTDGGSLAGGAEEQQDTVTNDEQGKAAETPDE